MLALLSTVVGFSLRLAAHSMRDSESGSALVNLALVLLFIVIGFYVSIYVGALMIGIYGFELLNLIRDKAERVDAFLDYFGVK